MRTLYVTAFNTKTKKCSGPSAPVPFTDMAQAEKMLGGEPALRTKNMSIYHHPNDQGVCLSWIRFAL